MDLGRTGGGRRRRTTVTTVIVRAYTGAPLMFQTRHRAVRPGLRARRRRSTRTRRPGGWRPAVRPPTAKLARASHLPRCETFFFFFSHPPQEQKATQSSPPTETAAAARVEVRGDGEILSQAISSQSDLLVKWGGVAPKMAEEAHALAIDQVVQKALDDANVSESDLSAVAVTIGPGLSLCLRVGVHKARKIAKVFGLPIVGVHHMEAHALVSRLVNKDLNYPFLALLISGGHNLLVLAQNLGEYVQLGTTIDDAIGEAYDKAARWLGLDIRKGGGPALEELALEGDPNSINFTVPMRQHKDCNFSYAGLKTQVRLTIESRNLCTDDIPISSATEEDRQLRANIAASFQRIAVLHLEDRCQRAVEWALKMKPSIKNFVVSGGVASNQYVRTRLNHIAEKNGLQLVSPPPSLCTDNGVMIAWTGIEHFVAGRFEDPPPADEPDDMQYDLRPRWPLGEEYSEGRSVSRSLKTARIHPSLTSMTQSSLHN
ncbi:probable tRNA N6-adenosine threonylcarbamoyltransferase, mitochondrial isoform X1 [Triticum aestivum]|uniref:probable tRNA N6-adenosine threonylcarbamoyltransferase, mitochondrial isoform X1 n=2 Tax=Triticum aestivum TaxID=4565 RepID=UPI001D01B9FC|nr:probable tRNA N6-adenosine threonylcarbamoyltransferase, mitochondrial isoform X1 [Triticum aestivum]XP_044387140.1 probable tRNA N6-adenosine threonylcarbamoyltransferase, mitochondrial isoform X1 [Triticum aestivum]